MIEQLERSTRTPPVNIVMRGSNWPASVEVGSVAATGGAAYVSATTRALG